MMRDTPTTVGFARGRINLSESERMKLVRYFVEELFRVEKIQDLMPSK